MFEWRSGRNSQNRHGDIVGTTALQRHSHQHQASFRWGIGCCDASEIHLADHAPKPVGTKQKRVSIFQRDGTIGSVRHNLPARAESSGEDVALRMKLGVF